MTEVTLLLLGLFLNGLGILGCVLPVLPGPLLSWLSLFVFLFIPHTDISNTTLMVTGVLMAVISVSDYAIPVLGAKRFGSSKEGIWGGAIGVVVGLFFFPPIGIILGPLIGTVIGDLIAGGTFTKALNSGMGSLIGFMVGTAIKLIYCVCIIVIFAIKSGDALGQIFI
jgi:hypothetical protein